MQMTNWINQRRVKVEMWEESSGVDVGCREWWWRRRRWRRSCCVATLISCNELINFVRRRFKLDLPAIGKKKLREVGRRCRSGESMPNPLDQLDRFGCLMKSFHYHPASIDWQSISINGPSKWTFVVSPVLSFLCLLMASWRSNRVVGFQLIQRIRVKWLHLAYFSFSLYDIERARGKNDDKLIEKGRKKWQPALIIHLGGVDSVDDVDGRPTLRSAGQSTRLTCRKADVVTFENWDSSPAAVLFSLHWFNCC